MSVKQISSQNFQEVEASDKPVLLDFYATWCGHCRRVAPLIEEIAEERDDIMVGKVDIGQEGELAKQFGVVSIPTLVVVKQGQVINRLVGYHPKKEIASLLSEGR